MTDEVMQMFKDAGALQEGHFLLTSGLHSPVYWEKFRVLQYPSYTERLCRLIAEHFKKDDIEVVAGPTTGGIILAFEVARQLGVKSIFAEKEGTKRIFRRSLTLNQGARVLVVDDVLTTGGSIKEVLDAVKHMGGMVIGVGVLVDRTRQELKFDAPLFSCLHTPAATYEPGVCPLCASDVPLVKPGSSTIS
jgi:orotate phosphoribosyltransferase